MISLLSRILKSVLAILRLGFFSDQSGRSEEGSRRGGMLREEACRATGGASKFRMNFFKVIRVPPGILLGLLFLMSPCLFAADGAPVGKTAKAPPKAAAAPDAAPQDVVDPFAARFDPDAVEAAPEPGKTATAVALPILEGIGLGGGDAYAVIGGSVYYKGEEKNGIKLLEARRGEVDIFVNGAPMVLPLFPKEELKKANERREKKGGPGLSSQGQPVKTTPASFPEGGQDL